MTATTDLAITPDESARPAAAKRHSPISEHQPEPRSNAGRVLIALFTGLPMLALIAAVPVAWIWGFLNWQTAVVGIAFYLLSGLGIAMGFHRYFTHTSFKANRAFKIALGVAGSMAVEGPILNWVSDHRKHHKYSDKEGDPHSPWRFGTNLRALVKGLIWAHMGWMFDRKITSPKKFSPDWLADKDITRVNRLFPVLTVATLVAPAVIVGLWTMSWKGALIAFFWAGLVRVSFLHHVTWSINSICHTFGKREFDARDKSRNVAWLAVLSFGESWHNLHHADPTCARHGVFKGQIDIAARSIWLAEKLGWAWNVKWPDADRLGGKKVGSVRELGAMTKPSAANPIS